MANQNMTLWNSVCVTDPSQVKPITGKQYRGNSPKPYWIIQRATEVFGPCGIGWGMTVQDSHFERLTADDVLHVALVHVWYDWDGKRGQVEHMGQTKACYRTAKGDLLIDEDAPKKSVTDGLIKALSMIGFAGDIFSGRWDDSSYVEHAANVTRKRTEEGADDRNARARATLEQAKALIGANDGTGFLKFVLLLADPSRQLGWIERQLTEDQRQWVAQIVEGHEFTTPETQV